MSGLDTRERLAELQKEIEQLYQEDRAYTKKSRHRAARDIPAHEQRVIRMRSILEKMARLMPRKTGPDV